MRPRDLFRRHVAVPAEHGAWAFLLVPLVIGLAAGERLHVPSLYLVVAALAGFLVRQPITLAVKALAGRRSRDELPIAVAWIAIYGAVAALHVLGLVLRGFGYVLWLAVPGIPVLAWYLVLIARRAERRQWLVEIAGAGALALAAPGAMWIGLGWPAPHGWVLWLLVWAQAASGIAYAYARLEQRRLVATPPLGERIDRAQWAWITAAGSTFGVALLAGVEIVPPALVLPYAVQLAETVHGTLSPAIGLRPTAIGWRQAAVTLVFAVLFVVAWSSASMVPSPVRE
jgi:hypothetical protein